MKKLTTKQIEDSFTKRVKDLKIPDLAGINWETREFLAWFHNDGSKAYLCTYYKDTPLGIELAITKAGNSLHTKMCSLCHTLHAGNSISLFTYSVIRPQYRTFGDYFCTNLNCSGYVRGTNTHNVQMQEDFTSEDKVIRLEMNLEKFIEQYLRNTGKSV
jgi:hypothetical protein